MEKSRQITEAYKDQRINEALKDVILKVIKHIKTNKEELVKKNPAIHKFITPKVNKSLTDISGFDLLSDPQDFTPQELKYFTDKTNGWLQFPNVKNALWSDKNTPRGLVLGKNKVLKNGTPTHLLLKFKIKKELTELGHEIIYTPYYINSKKFLDVVTQTKQVQVAPGYDPLGIDATTNSDI